MPILLGPFLSLMALLAVGGVAKILDPDPTSGALRAARLPNSRAAVLLLGFSELAVGLYGILVGGAVIASIAALFYLSFALFVLHALRNRLPISSCGCFGATDTPPTRIHLAVNLTAVAVLVVSALIPLDPLSALSSASLDAMILMLVFSGLAVYLLYGLIAVLPLRKASQRLVPISMLPNARSSVP